MNRKSDDAMAALIALLVACIIAASDWRGGGFMAQLAAYFYWICRIGTEAVLFISIRIVLERLSGRSGVDLGPVEIHRVRIIVAPMWIMASKLVSVLQARIAIRLNSLSF